MRVGLFAITGAVLGGLLPWLLIYWLLYTPRGEQANLFGFMLGLAAGAVGAPLGAVGGALFAARMERRYATRPPKGEAARGWTEVDFLLAHVRQPPGWYSVLTVIAAVFLCLIVVGGVVVFVAL
jgi:hypothetical protein